jgi:head-tail adaptor
MAGISAGRLNERIEIWNLDVSTNDYGEIKEDWIYKDSARTLVDHTGGNLTVENHELFNAYNKNFTVRNSVKVNDTDRIKYNDKFYRILYIDIDRPKMTKTINTELINE